MKSLSSLLVLVFGLGMLTNSLFAQDKRGTDTVDPRREEIESFFDKLSEAFNSGDTDQPGKLFSIELMISAAEDRGVLDIGDGARRRALITRMQGQMATTLATWSEWIAWDEHDIRNIEYPDENTAIVFLRQWDDDLEIYSKYRWWLRRDEGSWRFFDFADLDLNLRTSTMLGVTLKAAENDKPWVNELVNIVRAIQQYGSLEVMLMNMEDIGERAERLAAEDTPDEIRFFALVLIATQQIGEEDGAAAALETCQEMREINADSPIIFVMEGQALTQLEEYDRAIASYQKYADQYGWEADICELVSDIYFESGDKPKAAEFAIKGLADNPRAWGCLASLAVALPDDQKSRLDKHFTNIKNDIDAMEITIDWAIESGDMVTARYVYGLLQKHHGESELVKYYQELFDQ